MLYLHIGLGKTGSTSIQVFLEQNREALERRGIVTPTTLSRRNHRRLTMYALNDDVVDNLRRSKRMLTPDSVVRFRKKVLEDFAPEAASWRPDQTIVMTSEQMTRLQRPGEIERLRDFLSLTGHAVKVIVYVRRQDLYYVSEYSQHIKGGMDIEFCAEGRVANPNIYYYDVFLSKWAAVFDASEIIVRPFERTAMKNGDAVADFMSILGVDDLEPYVRPSITNQSLDAFTVEFLRQMNPAVPRFIDGRPNPSRDRLVSLLEAHSTGPKLRMSAENATRFLELFAESNAEVARTYLGREDGILFQEPVSDGADSQPALPLDEARRIAAILAVEGVFSQLDPVQLVAASAQLWTTLQSPAAG